MNIKESFLKSGQWSPLCVHLRFLLLGQRHPSVRCSSEASHGCMSSKRVQLSWQDSWQLISDPAGQRCTSFSPVSSFTFTSHNVTPALFSLHSRTSFPNCLQQRQFIMLGRVKRERFLHAFQIPGNASREKLHQNFYGVMTEISKWCIFLLNQRPCFTLGRWDDKCAF